MPVATKIFAKIMRVADRIKLRRCQHFAEVSDLIADELADHDAVDGRVSRAGSTWVWRKWE